MPVGFRDDLPAEERQATWLNDMCHDADCRVTDACLSYMLCRMHVLELRAPAVCSGVEGVWGGGGGGGGDELLGGSQGEGGQGGGVVEGMRRVAGAAGAAAAAAVAATAVAAVWRWL